MADKRRGLMDWRFTDVRTNELPTYCLSNRASRRDFFSKVTSSPNSQTDSHWRFDEGNIEKVLNFKYLWSSNQDELPLMKRNIFSRGCFVFSLCFLLPNCLFPSFACWVCSNDAHIAERSYVIKVLTNEFTEAIIAPTAIFMTRYGHFARLPPLYGAQSPDTFLLILQKSTALYGALP